MDYTEAEYQKLPDLYFQMLRIRRYEEAIAREYSKQQMRCPVHLSIGQEAPPVGVCSKLNEEDSVFAYHRGHAHYLAKGGSGKGLIAELHGRASGCAGGYGGSMHLISEDVGFLGSAPLVGGTVPLAVGVALAAKIRKRNTVSVTFFGDACFEEGVMHESLVFASLHALPVLFVCENNSYSVYTHLRLRQPKRPIWSVARAHGLQTDHGDGNNVLEVTRKSAEAIDRIRSGKGPQFLEFETYRCVEHCGPESGDDLPFRPKEELLEWKKRCPIEQTKKILLEKKCADSKSLAEMDAKIKKEIEEAFEFSLKSENPEKIFKRDYGI